jgi:DNA-damage-inducible protein D
LNLIVCTNEYGSEIILNLKQFSMENKNNLIPFEGEAIRKVWHNEQWYFSVVDVIYVLTDSPKPKTYWAMMKKRESQPFTNCEPLKLRAIDGRQRLTDCANTEGQHNTGLSQEL